MSTHRIQGLCSASKPFSSMMPIRCLEQSVRFFAAYHLVLALRHVCQGSIWNSTDGKVLAVSWPRIIIFRPSHGEASSVIVRVFNWKTELLWGVFFAPETVNRRCFKGLIPAHCETQTFDVDFKLLQEFLPIIFYQVHRASDDIAVERRYC